MGMMRGVMMRAIRNMRRIRSEDKNKNGSKIDCQ
jgi:hypothetical protein